MVDESLMKLTVKSSPTNQNKKSVQYNRIKFLSNVVSTVIEVGQIKITHCIIKPVLTKIHQTKPS